VPEAREITEQHTATGVVLWVGGNQDDPQDPVVRLRGQRPQFAPARQWHLLTLLGRVRVRSRWQDEPRRQ
jgi:hypothetical protein